MHVDEIIIDILVVIYLSDVVNQIFDYINTPTLTVMVVDLHIRET